MGLIKTLGSSTVISGLGSISSFYLTLLLAKEGGPVEFGLYAKAITWALILTVLIDFSAEKVFVHFAITLNRGVQYALNCVMTLKAYVFLVVVLTYLSFYFFSGLDLYPWQAVFFILPAFNLGPIFEYHNKNITFAALICFEKVLLLTINFAWISIFSFGVEAYYIYFFVSSISLAMQVSRYKNLIFSMRLALVRDVFGFLHQYWSLVVLGISQLGYGVVSRLIIGSKFDITVFANITLAFQIVALTSIIQSQVDRVFRPLFVKSISDFRQDIYKNLIYKYLTIYTLPMVFVSTFLYFFSSNLASFLYGDQYTLAGSSLSYLSPLIVTVGLIRLCDNVAVPFNFVRVNLVVNLTTITVLLSALSLLASGYPVSTYLGLIVFVQLIHIMICMFFVSRYSKKWFGG